MPLKRDSPDKGGSLKANAKKKVGAAPPDNDDAPITDDAEPAPSEERSAATPCGPPRLLSKFEVVLRTKTRSRPFGHGCARVASRGLAI